MLDHLILRLDRGRDFRDELYVRATRTSDSSALSSTDAPDQGSGSRVCPYAVEGGGLWSARARGAGASLER